MMGDFLEVCDFGLLMSGDMEVEINIWKDSYKGLYVDHLITNNPDPWEESVVDDVVKEALNSWFDNGIYGSWKNTSPKDAFLEDMKHWSE